MSDRLPITTGNPAQDYENFLVPDFFMPFAQVAIEQAALQSGERVLDVACGTGLMSRLAAPLVGRSGRVVGLDLSPGMLAVAREVSSESEDAAPIEWVEGNAQQLPFDDRSFDCLLCHHGLQFFPDKSAAVAEMHRVLDNGGRAVIACWQGLEHNAFFQAMSQASTQLIGVGIFEVPCSYGDPEALTSLLESAGFDQVHVETVTRPVRHADRARYIDRQIESASAAVPALAEIGPEGRRELIEQMRTLLAAELDARADGDDLVFPMTENLAIARRA
jgi:ubiquinone/menaquinone biosynthesis C-methylase UbiE